MKNGKTTKTAAPPPPATPAPKAKKAAKAPVISSAPAPAYARKVPVEKTASTVRLEIYAPTAHEVYVAGSFNDWRPSATAMLAADGGLWARDLALAPGKYEYLFLVDGKWIADPSAKEYAPNPFGGVNSLLQVPD